MNVGRAGLRFVVCSGDGQDEDSGPGPGMVVTPGEVQGGGWSVHPSIHPSVSRPPRVVRSVVGGPWHCGAWRGDEGSPARVCTVRQSCWEAGGPVPQRGCPSPVASPHHPPWHLPPSSLPAIFKVSVGNIDEGRTCSVLCKMQQTVLLTYNDCKRCKVCVCCWTFVTRSRFVQLLAALLSRCCRCSQRCLWPCIRCVEARPKW